MLRHILQSKSLFALYAHILYSLVCDIGLCVLSILIGTGTRLSSMQRFTLGIR